MSKILLTGAAGHMGKFALDTLLASGKVAPGDIVATTRDPKKLADYAAKGVEVRAADFDKPETLVTAFAGIDRLAIISTDAVDGTDKRLKQHLAAVAAAEKAGVKHIIYTSMPKPETSVIPFAPDHLGTEQAIKATGIAHTILRVSWYQENLLQSLPQALGSGQWFTSAEDGKIAYIARDDAARTVAAVLLADNNDSATYTLTGPELNTSAEIAALASDVTGKPIAIVPVTDEQLGEGLKQAGLPAPVIGLVVAIDTNTRQGGLDVLTDAVEKLTGTKPQSVRKFLEDHKAALLGA